MSKEISYLGRTLQGIRLRAQTLPVFLFLASVLFSIHGFSQSKTITGSVKNEKGEPISSASVAVKDTSIRTTTDVQGNFSIQVPQGKNVLAFSFVGYGAKEID